MGRKSYPAFVPDGSPHIIVHIETKNPIEIGDFVGAFTSVASQYRKFVQESYPELDGDADIYVTEVRQGSIIADLIPWAIVAWEQVPEHLKRAEIVIEFMRKYGASLGKYLRGDSRDEKATSSDLADYMRQVSAIAKDSNGTAALEVVIEDGKGGKKSVRAGVKFNSRQARHAMEQIERHQRVLEKTVSATHERVLMVFRQANTKDSPVGRRTGERVVIEEISPKDIALVYASALAEERIKHEIREADDNLFRKGFVVDVNVRRHAGKPALYQVTDVHEVVDLPDEG